MDQFTRLILRGAALPTALVGLVIAGISALAVDSRAALGAVLATIIVVVFFTIGQVILAYVLRTNPMMGMSVALLLYLVKIGVLLGLLILLSGSTTFNTRVFALTILICTLVWTAAEVWIFSRTKVLYVEPDDVPPAAKELHDLRYGDDRPL
jgi:ATP synthase protein I